MEFGLEENVVQKIKEVLSAFSEIEEAVIYGSRALGTYRNGSDIDLTLKAEHNFDQMIQIEKKLDDLMLPYTFDLSIYHNLHNKDLVAHIDRVGKQFFIKETIENN